MDFKILLLLFSFLLSFSAFSQQPEREDRNYKDNNHSDRLNRDKDLKEIRMEAVKERDRIIKKHHDFGDPCRLNKTLPVCPGEG